jgi:hypothetical protein
MQQLTAIDVLKTVLAIAIPLGTAAITTWVNITIKFAPDAAHAMREAKAIAFKIADWTTQAVVAGEIIWQIVSPFPNNRISLLVIILNSFVLFNAYMIRWNGRIMNLIYKQAIQTSALVQSVNMLTARTSATADLTHQSN